MGAFRVGGLDKFFKEKSELMFLFTLFIIILLSRLPFISKFLFDWDSVGFALAFDYFNTSIDQPQSPGYIFYVALGKIVNLLFQDPNLSMVFISIIFSCFTVFLIYFLAKQLFSKKVALVASLLLIFFPIFWFYGEIAAIYMAEALFATLIAYTSYQLLEGDNRFLIISSIVLGLSGGFRQDLIFFMFPLWFFCLVYHNFEFKKILIGLVGLFSSALLWFIPTFILSSGYFSSTNDLLIGSFQSSSIFFGADFLSHLMMDYRLISWTLIGIGIFSSLILWCYISFNWRKIFNSLDLENYKFIFLLLWILPAFMFYSLIYIGKPGYTLVYLPVFSIILAYIILNVSEVFHKKIEKVSLNQFLLLIIVLIVLSSGLQFLIPENVNGYAVIELSDDKIQYYNESLNLFNPNTTMIFYGSADDFRKSMYYFPNFESYSYVYYSRSKNQHIELYHYQNGYVKIIKNQNTILINSSTDRIIWFIDTNFYINDYSFLKELESKIIVHNYTLPDGSIIFYSDITRNTEFTVNNITFKMD